MADSANRSTLRLGDVTFELLDVGADNSADETAAAIVHLHVRKGLDIRARWRSIGEVDLAQRNVGIGCRHLLQGWRELSAWGAPVCMEINQRHLAGHGFNGLTATGDCERRKTQN